MSNLIVHPGSNVSLATLAAEPFYLLDKYAEGGIAEATPRIDALATISAGQKSTKDGKFFPTRSRDGKMFLHDADNRAPGLKAAMEATGYKSLTVAFPFNDLRSILQQRFTLYTASQLRAYGDENGITVTDDKGDRVTHLAGTSEYERIIPQCEVSSSVYFHLARWNKNGQPEVYFPDGLGLYRLRFTSRNSSRAIVSNLQTTARFMGGVLAGIPFELRIVNREVSDSKSKRQTIPVWTVTFNPPAELSFTSRNFRAIAAEAIEQGKLLMLPAPAAETFETELASGQEPDLDEITDEGIEVLVQGGLCDKEHYTRLWFATVKDTPYASDEARAVFIRTHCETYGLPETDSLATFLERSSDAQAGELISDLHEAIDAVIERKMREYEVLVERGKRLGIPERTPEGVLTLRKINHLLTCLQNAIERREQAQVEASQAGDSLEDARAGGVTAPTALGRVLQRASYRDPEAEELFSRDEPDVPESVGTLLRLTHEGGVAHGGDFAHPQLLDIVNGWLSRCNPPRPTVASVLDMADGDVRLVNLAIHKQEITLAQ